MEQTARRSGQPTRSSADCGLFTMSRESKFRADCDSAHCLNFDTLWYSVYEDTKLHHLTLGPVNGSRGQGWVRLPDEKRRQRSSGANRKECHCEEIFYDITISILLPSEYKLGHHQPVATAEGGALRAELVGDLAAAVAPHRFESKHLSCELRRSEVSDFIAALLVKLTGTFETCLESKMCRPLQNAMLLDRSLFDLAGRYQPEKCDRVSYRQTLSAYDEAGRRNKIRNHTLNRSQAACTLSSKTFTGRWKGVNLYRVAVTP
ncbi:hypothetical protein AK812_SmicGene22082 [Symbiodinium microadriaticum]|uniref:Generative cell specific-1/HAP2 domain-containing protein n=1 Tax=Symbiodinium microadriaticum TaxID=2951 RepID=A0A1Q9DKR8_SYMMI|nr:hypothetical protein AK812_SmicGene22082 [Symbiodinium microadriaticum]